MNVEEFERLLVQMVSTEQDTLIAKRRAYAGDGDVLRNFREIGAFLGISPELVCLQYLVKHIQSILNAIRKEGNLTYTWWEGMDEGLAQRITDARNYLALLAALLKERANDVDAESGPQDS